MANQWADYWRNKVGVNVIPNDSVNKKPRVEWGKWHSEPVPQQLHDEWKSSGMFELGMALAVGRAWHLNNGNNESNKLFLVAIDCDNMNAVNYAMASLPFASMARESRGVAEKLHLYFYAREQMDNYTPADDAPIRIELHAQKHLITCTPSEYGKKGDDGTCRPTGKFYKLLSPSFGILEPKSIVMPAGGVKKRRAKDGLPFDVISEGGRNHGFFSVCVSFMKKFKTSDKFDNDLAWVYLWNYNRKYCRPPLEEMEARAVFDSSLTYKEPDDLGTDKVIGG